MKITSEKLKGEKIITKGKQQINVDSCRIQESSRELWRMWGPGGACQEPDDWDDITFNLADTFPKTKLKIKSHTRYFVYNTFE